MDDKKKGISSDITDEQREILRAQLNYFFPIWLGEKQKKRILEELPEVELNILMQAIFLPSISEERKKFLSNDLEYKKIEKLLNQVKEGKDILLNDLIKIYEDKKKEIKDSYKEKIWDFKLRKLPKSKREQVQNLLNSGMRDKAKIVINNYYTGNQNIVKPVNECYKIFLNNIENRNFELLSSKVLSANEGLIVKIANIIYDPGYLVAPELDRLLNDKSEIPSQWYLYRKMTISDYKEFTENVSDVKTWNKQYNYAVNNIVKSLEVPIIPIVKRKVIINEIIKNISDKRNNSAMITIFSVIEGLLWELSYEVNKIEKVYVEKGVIHDYVNNCDFESTRIRDIIERSVVRKYLDEKFLYEFCYELYEERNPVLHGNMICFGECNNSALCFIKKIFVLDYIIETIIEIYRKNLFSSWDEEFSEEKIALWINLLYK